jgi:hypothetical protein
MSSENNVGGVFLVFTEKVLRQNHTKVFFFPFKWKLCKLFHVFENCFFINLLKLVCDLVILSV